MSFLTEILAVKQEEVAEARRRVSEAALRDLPRPPRRDFAAALRRERLAVIAEIKRASPSKGALAPGLDPARQAMAYERGGAAALSVLTDRRFFHGSLADLQAAREATALPILRKDFLLDPYQVVEAAVHGADAVLLIVAALGRSQLLELLAAAQEEGVAALVEVHTAEELAVAADAGAELLGINNRDLRTFAVDLNTTLRLLPQAPPGALVVAESGVAGPVEAALLAGAGVDAVLVGEALVRSADPAGLIQALRAAGGTAGWGRRSAGGGGGAGCS
ncbi:MAG TPA: indole-3-glycerol phosphate synthase TrpC [Firmicutes bacterium]|nr:indole-3-glycerol phosphate synthase TrpC [Bacillota bacterium]